MKWGIAKGAIGGWLSGNEQVNRATTIGRAQPLGRLIGDVRSHAMAEQGERQSQEWLKRVAQRFDKRADLLEWHLVDPRATAWQFDGTEIDLGRHETPPRPVEDGVAPGVGKAKEAATNGRIVGPVWNPLIERHLSSQQTVWRWGALAPAGRLPDDHRVFKRREENVER
jgi:hypothetical protein